MSTSNSVASTDPGLHYHVASEYTSRFRFLYKAQVYEELDSHIENTIQIMSMNQSR